MNAKSKTDDTVYIFDTTLRDGEQSPGCTMNVQEKLKLALQLAKLNVDAIEAGFPMSSQGDFDAVELIARNVYGPAIVGLCRTGFADIDRAWNAIKASERPRIHTFIATSPVHMKKKLEMTPRQVVKAAVEAVKRARGYCDEVEFSPEDASRSEFDFLAEVVEKVIAAGATHVNIPDTVGYAIPEEFGKLIGNLIKKVPNSGRAVFSVHCHNDLGLAVANSLAAIRNGARQVECTINGLGERAGNASLEEIVMAIYTRHDLMGVKTNIITQEIYRTSRMVSKITGFTVQPNKAIVGRNAFAHEAGIHQHGVLRDKRTYEIMDAETIGIATSSLVLGKHSGRHAFNDKLIELGYELDTAMLNKAFSRFKNLCDQKKEVTDDDIQSIIEDELTVVDETYRLQSVHVMCGGTAKATAMIEMLHQSELLEQAAIGVGPIDAVYQCIRQIAGVDIKLVDFSVKSVTGGMDALGEVTARISDESGKIFSGRGAELDIVLASAKAYVMAINKLLHWRKGIEAKPARRKAAAKG
jgi:2-isopropylmalate synthase